MFQHEIPQVAKLHNALAYFIQETTHDEYWDFETLSEENISKHLETYLDHPERSVFIAVDDETVIGFIVGEIMGCHLPISSIKRVGYIAGAYVLPEYRGHGIMKKLEQLATEFFKACGVSYSELHFISANELAKKSWESLGYKTFREQARKKI